MSISVTERDGITVVVGAGEVDFDAVRELFEGIRADGSSRETFRILIRDEGTTFAPFTDQLTELVRTVGHLFDGVEVRIAVMAGRPVQYGVGRMFEARSHGAGFAARAFREDEEAEAVRWLREPPETG